MLSIFAEPIAPGSISSQTIWQEPIRQESISEEIGVAEREQESRRSPFFEDASCGDQTGSEPVEVKVADETHEEFEIVLGRRQIAGVLFVATVVLALFSAVSYLAGKSISPKKATPGMPAGPSSAVLAASVPVPVSQAPVIDASIALSAPSPVVKPAIGVAKIPAVNPSTRIAPLKGPTTSVEDSTEAPMFAEPVGGGMYLQMGAVDKGAAAIFAEGLRKRGFPSFVATGPNATLFRVLIGPLRDAAAYARTKDALDRMGVNTFGRTYEK